MRPRPCDRGSTLLRQRPPPPAPASMRPRPCDRGSFPESFDLADTWPASMRPRPCDRGSSEFLRQIGFRNLCASMRPRPCDRGSLIKRRFRVGILPSFNEAAALRPRKSGAGSRGGPTRPCFNEAAALRPRKSVRLVSGALKHPASMRPRPCDRGSGQVAGGQGGEPMLQ